MVVGDTMSANLIATCIAGTASQGKVFSSLRYNDERMAKLNNKREDELFAYSSYPNLGTSLSAGSLNLPASTALSEMERPLPVNSSLIP